MNKAKEYADYLYKRYTEVFTSSRSGVTISEEEMKKREEEEKEVFQTMQVNKDELIEQIHKEENDLTEMGVLSHSAQVQHDLPIVMEEKESENEDEESDDDDAEEPNFIISESERLDMTKMYTATPNGFVEVTEFIDLTGDDTEVVTEETMQIDHVSESEQESEESDSGSEFTVSDEHSEDESNDGEHVKALRRTTRFSKQKNASVRVYIPETPLTDNDIEEQEWNDVNVVRLIDVSVYDEMSAQEEEEEEQQQQQQDYDQQQDVIVEQQPQEDNNNNPVDFMGNELLPLNPVVLNPTIDEVLEERFQEANANNANEDEIDNLTEGMQRLTHNNTPKHGKQRVKRKLAFQAAGPYYKEKPSRRNPLQRHSRRINN
jgi:hypothetical protein